MFGDDLLMRRKDKRLETGYWNEIRSINLKGSARIELHHRVSNRERVDNVRRFFGDIFRSMLREL